MPLGVNLRGTILYGDDPVTKYISIFFLSHVSFIILYNLIVFFFCYFSVNLIITFLNVRYVR